MKSFLWNSFLIIIYFLFSINTMAASQALSSHFENFIKEIRCVVCQNQSLADSHAPLANDLREKIYTLMVNKKTDEEIKDYLVSRYGEFILLKPRINALTLFLWLFPFIGLGIAILLVFLNKRYSKN
jgi:cytochrome c-type biogenesis protein CcmH